MNPVIRIKQMLAMIPGARWVKHRLLGPGQPGQARAWGGRLSWPEIPISRPADRGPLPAADHARLAAHYRETPVSDEPDTFVLYRIIGNDLPPRHALGQSRENLAFILENEPELPRCEKRFVVNRIVDPGEEEAVLRLLDDAGAGYLHLPFDREAYRQVSWDIAGVPAAYLPWTRGFSKLSEAHQGRILMRLYRHKNNYVMNNNGARNAALREGRGIAKWVLPWDGNCFVTASAWRELTDSVHAAPELPYFIVPMARTTDNACLLDDAHRPDAEEEPQILFRRDAALEFDPECWYGRRPKVDLFWRLGVPGKWDYWSIEPWDRPCPPYADDAGNYKNAGWVARLFSGQAHLEASDVGRERGFARVEAIQLLLDHLDDKLRKHKQSSDQLCILVEDGLNDPSIKMLKFSKYISEIADKALTRGPYCVADKKTLPPSGNRHDYWYPSPYYWPHPFRIFGKPHVRRDGRRVPGTRLYEPLSEKYDRTRLQRLFDDTFVLALAWRVHGDQRHAEHAARLIRTWFLDPETAMNPHLEYAQVRWGHNGNRGNSSGIIEMKDLYYFFDAVRLLQEGGWLSPDEQGRLQAWFEQYLSWLRASPQGIQERASMNNHGTYYDLQVASIAAFLGEDRLVRHTLRDSRSRLLQQIDAAGRQPEEMKRTTTAHYCCFNLQGWIHLAMLAEACGEDLWNFEGDDGRGIRKAMHWLLPHIGQEWPYPQLDAFDAERFYPIFHACRARYGDVPDVDAGRVPPPAEIKPIFFPHDGILPFWQFGLRELLSAARGEHEVAQAVQ